MSAAGANSPGSEAIMLLGDMADEGLAASATSGKFQEVSPVSLQARNTRTIQKAVRIEQMNGARWGGEEGGAPGEADGSSARGAADKDGMAAARRK